MVIHTIKGFSIISKAEIDAFLEFCCLFYEPMDVGDLISASSAFSKSSLNIWKFSVHELLKPSLKNFEHYFASKWNDCTLAIWTFLALPFFGTGMKTDLFPSCGHCWVFQICWHIEQHLKSIIFWNLKKLSWNSTTSTSFVQFKPALNVLLMKNENINLMPHFLNLWPWDPQIKCICSNIFVFNTHLISNCRTMFSGLVLKLWQIHLSLLHFQS